MSLVGYGLGVSVSPSRFSFLRSRAVMVTAEMSELVLCCMATMQPSRFDTHLLNQVQVFPTLHHLIGRSDVHHAADKEICISTRVPFSELPSLVQCPLRSVEVDLLCDGMFDTPVGLETSGEVRPTVCLFTMYSDGLQPLSSSHRYAAVCAVSHQTPRLS